MYAKNDIGFDISHLPVDFTTGIKELQADYKFTLYGETVLTAKQGGIEIVKLKTVLKLRT